MSDKLPTNLEHFGNISANYEASTGGCTRELSWHLLSLLPPISEKSTIHDNACGNGIVSQELLFKYPDVSFSVTCTDGAEGMVNLAKHVVSSANKVATLTFDVMPGEDLSKLPSDSFSHSITNQGILFFKDGAQGAREIYRTLAPGGTAIVTSWSSLGYMPLIHAAQRSAKPDAPLFQIPISPEWFKPSHLEKHLQDAGFGDVQMQEKVVYFGAKSVDDLCDGLMRLFVMIAQSWTDDEKKVFRESLQKAAEELVVDVQRPVNGSAPQEMLNIIGVPMTAIVAIAKK